MIFYISRLAIFLTLISGQGFAALQKKKILQKFNRTFKRKKGDNKVTSPITTNPLTESLDNSLHQDMLTDCGANETIVSGNITSHSRLTLLVLPPVVFYLLYEAV